MSNSPEFSNMQIRINDLQTEFIPAVKPDGSYTHKEQDEMGAYILFVHAEFETYFEKICMNKLNTAFSQWNAAKSTYASHVLLALACFMDSDEIRNAGQLESKITLKKIAYEGKVRKNNGIKETDIKSLLKPIGVDIDSLDNTLISSLDSFGSDRGSIAHTGSITKVLDPVTIVNEVNQIVSSLGVLDIALQALS